jgi:hypothetical protein
MLGADANVMPRFIVIITLAVTGSSAATGWRAHSVRGFMSGGLGKKLGLTVTSEKEAGRGQVYRLNRATT